MNEPTPPSTRPESATDYVDAIMRREQEKAAAPPPPPPRPPRPIALIALIPVFFGLVAWNVTLYARQPDVFTPQEEEAAARFYVYLTAVAVEDYRAEHAQLPASLAELGLEDDGVEYTLAGSGYVLAAAAPSGTVSYRAGEDLQPFADAWNSFQRETL